MMRRTSGLLCMSAAFMMDVNGWMFMSEGIWSRTLIGLDFLGEEPEGETLD